MANAAELAQPALDKLQDRLADRLRVGSFRIVERQGGIRYTPAVAGIMVVLAAGLFVAALIYAALK